MCFAVCDGCPEMPPGTKHPSCKMPSLLDPALSMISFLFYHILQPMLNWSTLKLNSCKRPRSADPFMIQFCTCASICFGGSVGFQSQLGSTMHQSSAKYSKPIWEFMRIPCGWNLDQLATWNVETFDGNSFGQILGAWCRGCFRCYPQTSINVGFQRNKALGVSSRIFKYPFEFKHNYCPKEKKRQLALFFICKGVLCIIASCRAVFTM